MATLEKTMPAAITAFVSGGVRGARARVLYAYHA